MRLIELLQQNLRSRCRPSQIRPKRRPRAGPRWRRSRPATGEPHDPDREPAQGRLTKFPPADFAFTLMPTSPTSLRTVLLSPAKCWKRRMWRPPRAAISIRSMAAASFDFPMRARPTRCGKRLRGSLIGLNSARYKSLLPEMTLSVRSVSEPAAVRHFPLASMVWPERSGTLVGMVRALFLVAFGTALLTLSAKVNLPLPHAPMTLQTLVVLMIGAAYGWRSGGATRDRVSGGRRIRLPGVCRPRRRAAPLVGLTCGVSVRLRGGGCRHGLAQSAVGTATWPGCSGHGDRPLYHPGRRFPGSPSA